MACQILGYKRSELQKLTLNNLISNLEEQDVEALEETDLICTKKSESDIYVKGTVLVCGKVVSYRFHKIIALKWHLRHEIENLIQMSV